ncbi:TetR family transcriptional regulator [Planctomycetota bacterium]|nr:TetR family transcriptional regulator [Planctomycetota bacterium]
MNNTETKQKILDTAQELFAKHGYSNTSLRQITSGAGVNLAAVSYYFGGKEQLLFELVGNTLRPLNAERLLRLDALTNEHSTEDVVRCFLEPAIDILSKDNCDIPCILGQAHREQNLALQAFLAQEARPVAARFIDAIHNTLPQLGTAEILARGEFMIGALLHILYSQTTVSRALAPDQQQLNDNTFIAEQLIEFCTAGFSNE